MRHIPRWLVFAAVVTVVVLGLLASLAVTNVRGSYPSMSGTVTLTGLERPVEVLRDVYGVPHIYADTAEDLFAAQGYVHAQDRFYEMDVRRHITAGRLSELFGASQVETDAYIRTMGWRRVAARELPLLSPGTRRYLDAYSDGVNAYLKERPTNDLSLEYTLLSIQGLTYTPEPWTALDSVAWLKALAWDLSSNMNQEIEQALMTAVVGSEQAARLFPDFPYEGATPILTRGRVADGAFDPSAPAGNPRSAPAAPGHSVRVGASGVLASAAKVTAAIPPLVGSRSIGAEVGSNSWVVSGSRTVSGSTLLSNDPHLSTSIPSIFAQVGLHCRVITEECPFDVSGFSFSGMPGVLVGHNTAFAWGLSTSYVDVLDLFLEDVQGDTVRQDRTFVPLSVRREKIKVAGEEPRTITVRTSAHGPLISDVDQQIARLGATQTTSAASPYAVALSWVALTPGRSMDAVFGLNKATDFDSFREALSLVSAPSQNVVYADRNGNIGYQLSGAVPTRGSGNGRLPHPGWDPRYNWKGLVPFAELPYEYNPPSGMIVAANQQTIGSQYSHELGANYSYGWRSQELIADLKSAQPLTAESAEFLFYDQHIGYADAIVPTLLKVRLSDAWVQEGQQTLLGWDYRASDDSRAAAYFYVVIHNILKATFRDEMPEDLWPAGGDRWYAVIADLLTRPNDPWWDNILTEDVVETRDVILAAAMTQARKELTSLMARETDTWQWGKIHTITLQHQTLGSSGIAPIEALFNRGSYPSGGAPAVVNAMSFDTTEGYAVTAGPTMRMVVDLGDLDLSRWVNQSGASGHAFHPNYDDQMQLWVDQRMWPFVSSRAKVEAATVNRLKLVPGG